MKKLLVEEYWLSLFGNVLRLSICTERNWSAILICKPGLEVKSGLIPSFVF